MKLLESDIMIVQPTTPTDVDLIAEDILKVAQYLPNFDPDFLSGGDGMRMYPDQFTLIYYKDEPVAYAEINDNSTFEHLGKDSLEFGGVIIPEYRGCGLLQSAAKAIIQDAFRRTGKKKMFSIISPDNVAAQQAVKVLGFRHIGKSASKDLLYCIKRSEALNHA